MRDKDGKSLGLERAHLETAARQGSAVAREKLEGPEFPEALRYLLEWVNELHGRSGMGQDGHHPMTWATVDAWARWSGNTPDSEDVSALFALDAVLLHPDPPKPEGAE